MYLTCNGSVDPVGMDPDNIQLRFSAATLCADEPVTLTLRQDSTGAVVDTTTLRLPAAPLWRPAARLHAGERYRWTVRAVARTGKPVEETAYFETLPPLTAGRWVAAPAYDGMVQEFCQSFTARAGEQLRLYLCGLGFFRAYCNGRPVDTAYFVPLLTDYDIRHTDNPLLAHESAAHRCCCYTYSLDGLVQPGENRLTVLVAPGYYCNEDRRGMEPDFSFDKPKLFFELHRAGHVPVAVSAPGETAVRSTGCRSTLYRGDVIRFGKNPRPYAPSVAATPPAGRWISPAPCEDRVLETLSPVETIRTADGLLLDFGKNHSGMLHFTAQGAPGDVIRVAFAEKLRADGTLNPATSGWHGCDPASGEPVVMEQEATYILSGEVDTIEPQFHWNAYRYARLTVPPGVELGAVQSRFITAGLRQDGRFTCSEPTLNKLHEAFLLTFRCNAHCGVLSDCPHREKLPYTGDGRLVMASAWYLLDCREFYEKWLEDLLDAQQTDGLIPNSAPYLGGGGGYAWANALCTVARLLYGFTGDRSVPERAYPAVRRLLEYYAAKQDPDGAIRHNGHSWMLGDWLAPEMVASDVYYISTVCYLEAARTALWLARLVAPADVPALTRQCMAIREAINRCFFHPDTLCYGNGVQGEDVLALAYALPPPETAQRLREKVRRHYTEETGYHLDTGIVLTPVLIRYLTDAGMADIAYWIMTAPDYPSYAAMLEGETTLSEHWSRRWPDYRIGADGSSIVKGGQELSHCHPMLGSTVAWLYERVAGLELTRLCEGVVTVHPAVLELLTHAAAEKETPFGKAAVAWRRENGTVQLTVEIPNALRGEVELTYPAAAATVCGAEKYTAAMPEGRLRLQLPAGRWTITLTREDEEP